MVAKIAFALFAILAGSAASAEAQVASRNSPVALVAGPILMVGGAVMGLYGLYLYLR